LDGERISLRLETEDLELLDEFIEKHPEYSNRSNLARVAFRAFIEQIEGANKTSAEDTKQESNMVSVRVPPFIHNSIVKLVRTGIYNSTEEAVLDCVRKVYITSDKAREAMLQADLEAYVNTVQVYPG
jgi:Arc/MetJ-type ribon-helix-helix transcriptional regulator